MICSANFVFLITFFAAVVQSDKISIDESKRLLLNDPNVIINRLTKLENLVAQLQNDNQRLTEENKQQSAKVSHLEKISSASGSTYIIWGRTGCPSNNDTELLYTGYAGGGIYTDKGSSQDLLCMTATPTFGKTSGADYGRVFGVEYDHDFFGIGANGEDLPCAVCHRKSSTSSVMIPGRNTCYPGWKLDYDGYLSSGYHGADNRGTSYVCMDSNPEFLVAGDANTNLGRMMGPVVAKCGVLKCPPYHNDYPITCVVCSK